MNFATFVDVVILIAAFLGAIAAIYNFFFKAGKGVKRKVDTAKEEQEKEFNKKVEEREADHTAKLQQKAADGHFIVPVLTKFVQLAEQYKKHNANIEKAELDEEAVEVYQKALESSVEYLTVMLQSLGVVIKDLGDEVDFKYQRAVNKIKSEDLVGKTIYIEHTITDCYMYNDRVFYPSKVRIGAK